MIQNLLNIPQSDADWDTFAFAHAQAHTAIRQALLSKKNISTGDYVLDPIPPAAVNEWLGRVQQTHSEMNGALGLNSNDLSSVDFADEAQKRAWIYLNWQEDNAAMQALEI